MRQWYKGLKSFVYHEHKFSPKFYVYEYVQRSPLVGYQYILRTDQKIGASVLILVLEYKLEGNIW